MKVTLKIEYRTHWGESLAVVIKKQKFPMKWNDGGIWSVSLDVTAADLKDYTYVVMKGGLICRSEWTHHSSKASSTIIDHWLDCPIQGCPFPQKHQAAIFDKPGFRGAGTAIPVFSLRTPNDFGIGEFRDLRPLVDWAAATGQCIIQLLPVNDTTRKGEWADSYPYNPVSSFGLNPMYIHLQDLGIKETASFKKIQKELNDLPEIDYPRVFKEKTALMRKAFKECGAAQTGTPEFKKFVKDNSRWLADYSKFCAKRDHDDPQFHDWIQWHLDKQFSEEVAYARGKGVVLKGDLPIGVSADSEEAHSHPELFNLDSSAGAPPDFFSADGQNWGFPTYNWDTMAKDDYAWWKARLRKMSAYFDAFRIDHILGFFRIWEIPVEHTSGLKGHFNPCLPYSKQEIELKGLPLDEKIFLPDPRHPGMYVPAITPNLDGLQEWQKQNFNEMHTDFFYHRHNEFWRVNAEKKLPELLGATGMLACGEDLGMVPDCVPGVMDHWKILSLEMANMEKGRPWPYLSVCATSSHDMSTLRMQCVERGESDPSSGKVREILSAHLTSQSMLAIFPLQDWVALDEDFRRQECNEERINQPADPHHHWRFRFHRNIGELLEEKNLTVEIRELLTATSRI